MKLENQENLKIFKSSKKNLELLDIIANVVCLKLLSQKDCSFWVIWFRLQDSCNKSQR